MTEATVTPTGIETKVVETVTTTSGGLWGAITRHPFRAIGAAAAAVGAGTYAFVTFAGGGNAEDAVEAVETAANMARSLFD